MSNNLSQEEINALLGPDDGNGEQDLLTAGQEDILGEVGNISMGTSATTLSTLLNQKVQITAPVVKTMDWNQISDNYDRPCVGVKIDYTVGIKGSNVLILRNTDVKIIADLMMGGAGQIDGSDDTVSEIELSAIGEAMNQMIGSSSTSLSSFVDERIDMTTPKAFQLDFNEDNFAANFGFSEEPVAVVTFKLTIGDLVDSEIMQVYPIEFAVTVTNQLQSAFGGGDATPDPAPEPSAPAAEPAPAPMAPQQQQAPPQQQQHYQPPHGMPPQPPQGVPMAPQYDMGAYNMQAQHNYAPQQHANAKAAQFQNFDVSSVMQQKENIDILMDVPLEVTVELGKTSKRIKDILEFSPGTIIELEKLAGEPIDILVNGKYVAKGEVVVIDENFGIRVTSIISPEFRI